MERQHLNTITSVPLGWRGLTACVKSTPRAWIVKQEGFATQGSAYSFLNYLSPEDSGQLPPTAPVHSLLLFLLQNDAVNYITELIQIKSDWPDHVLTQTFEEASARLRTQWWGCVCGLRPTLAPTSEGLKWVCICSLREAVNVLGNSQEDGNY